MSIPYDHSRNVHTLEGPKSALPLLFPDGMPTSVLDVGCGRGTWLRALLDSGVREVVGIDGVNIPPEQLLFEPKDFKQCDLTAPFDLGRRFDAVLCLEVGEHLDEQFASGLIQSLTRHADRILFSAARPGQTGQHHVNCQWPGYWQQLFNREGFACEDSLRWRIWSLQGIEPWYRQNLFLARRDLQQAGLEARIPAVVHPELLPNFEDARQALIDSSRREQILQIERGSMPVGWYFGNTVRALGSKLRRSLAGSKAGQIGN